MTSSWIATVQTEIANTPVWIAMVQTEIANAPSWIATVATASADVATEIAGTPTARAADQTPVEIAEESLGLCPANLPIGGLGDRGMQGERQNSHLGGLFLTFFSIGIVDTYYCSGENQILPKLTNTVHRKEQS